MAKKYLLTSDKVPEVWQGISEEYSALPTSKTSDDVIYVIADDDSNKAKMIINGKEISGGDSGDTIKETTKAEYNDLTEAEKKDKTFIITDAGTPETIVSMVSGDANNTLTVGSDNGLYVAKVTVPTVSNTYSSSSTDAMSGKAVASAISGKANSSALGTQVTYTLSGTTLYINTK